jgi:tRNA(Ile)-lysidine synthase
MLSKVSKFIEENELLSHEELHVVALSGGSDSVALLHILKQLDYRIEAAHCNFHLRGFESDRDESFVKKLCESLDVRLHLVHFKPEDYASIHKVSIEMAARDLRYSYFRQLCKDIGAASICVGHHRDDVVETFLMNLLRGSGIHGLTGIRVKNGIVVRPLLCLSRQDILKYLDSIGQDYVTDSTNFVDDVLRNKLRLNVLPLLKDINPSVAENIDKTANYLQEAEKIFNKEISRELAGHVKHDRTNGRQLVSILEILELPSPEAFLHEWLSPLGYNRTQIEQIFLHLIGESGRVFESASYDLLIDRNCVIVEPRKSPIKPLKIPEVGLYNIIDNLSIRFEFCDSVTISKSINCVTLDKESVCFPLLVRLVENGDAFCPFGMEGHKLVSDFLTDIKVPLFEKRRQLVVTDVNGEILWVVGRRIDNRYKVNKHTSSILRITLYNTL